MTCYFTCLTEFYELSLLDLHCCGLTQQLKIHQNDIGLIAGKPDFVVSGFIQAGVKCKDYSRTSKNLSNSFQGLKVNEKY